jgi:fido (protein-threonine AMPylation protein)
MSVATARTYRSNFPWGQKESSEVYRVNKDPFQEYIKESEPAKRDKGYAWHTAIGLQAVDGLKTSEYLVYTAVRNIEGEISFEEANALLQTYYEGNPTRDTSDRTEEADKVSARIAALLSERAFSFTPNEYLSIHRKLFTGIYSHAGRIRDYNITKKEWGLNGATVLYGSATELRATLDYDFSEEKKFSYKNLSMDEIIHHLAVFVSRLWQIHVFGEGNTRTTAVFFIKYLCMLGFDVTNDIFAENAWYFRNSLVRANYNDLKNGIHETTEFLEMFLRNLLLNENHPLHNRTLHISGTFKEIEKPDIETEKPDIDALKPDIENAFQPKTASHILKLREAFPGQTIFGRSDVMKVIDIKASRASDLLREMAEHGIIEPVSGHGKGKYRFRQH